MMADSGSSSRILTHSKELLDVGNKSSALDTLLMTRSKPERLPPSSVLSRVKSFLPQLEESNRALQQRLESEPAENLDIENIIDYDGPVIEMSIAIKEHEGGSSDSESDSALSSTDEDDSSDEDMESGLLDEVSTDNIKLPHSGSQKKKKKPVIEELSPVNKDIDEESCRLVKER